MPQSITNSLLRLDGVRGPAPSPFQRPKDKLDFFVLELGTDDDVESWCARTTETLSRHSGVLRRLREAGAVATLFVESAASLPVLRFDSRFLSVLAHGGISLEYSHEDARIMR
jgi:hypothetical protein